jgi:hypothetical protein
MTVGLQRTASSHLISLVCPLQLAAGTIKTYPCKPERSTSFAIILPTPHHSHTLPDIMGQPPHAPTESLTVRDERTGKTYTIPITDNTIPATSLPHTS